MQRRGGRGKGALSRRAVLLGRVSRGERQQEPKSQLVPLRAAAARLGWTVAREVEVTLSAWDATTAAEVRRQALAPIIAGEADTLMVWGWDRYSREGIEAAFRELRYLEDHLGAALWSLQEPFLSTAGADKQQRDLLLSIIAWAARWESERKSQRLRTKVESKRARAEVIGQRARWGRGAVATWAEVARVRELRATGRSVREIAREVGVSRLQMARFLASAPQPPHCAPDRRDSPGVGG
jgi:DNA invertase Pin-like site-specific DNA recombinase